MDRFRKATLAAAALTLTLVAGACGSNDGGSSPGSGASASLTGDINISGSGSVRLASRHVRLTQHIAGSGRISQPAIEAAEGKK